MDNVILKVNHLYKKYGFNKDYTLKDCNLTVEGGSIFGFLGPNGAGKSTIIKTTMGITNATKGEINVCGVNLLKEYEKGKMLVGYVPDQYVLYEKLTCYEYLTYVGDVYRVNKETLDKRIRFYCDRFNLTYAMNRKIQTYSHGMKQKVALISALIHEPKLWILDEPLTGLDPISVIQVKETMKEYADKGNIVFFSSHLIDIVKKLCDRIAIIYNGEIRCVVSVKELELKGIELEKFYLDTISKIS